MELVLSDELLGTFVPIIVYWLYSGLYVILGNLDSSGEYRLHPRSEEAKNIVSKVAVVKGVLVQQAFQIVVALCLFAVIISSSPYSLIDLPPHPLIRGGNDSQYSCLRLSNMKLFTCTICLLSFFGTQLDVRVLKGLSFSDLGFPCVKLNSLSFRE